MAFQILTKKCIELCGPVFYALRCTLFVCMCQLFLTWLSIKLRRNLHFFKLTHFPTEFRFGSHIQRVMGSRTSSKQRFGEGGKLIEDQMIRIWKLRSLCSGHFHPFSYAYKSAPLIPGEKGSILTQKFPNSKTINQYIKSTLLLCQ